MRNKFAAVAPTTPLTVSIFRSSTSTNVTVCPAALTAKLSTSLAATSKVVAADVFVIERLVATVLWVSD
ncbi:MAG: hypothetical protein OQJ97_08395, partial [Rhodospirillales bacterium]|nr:hypothetical protein [Rhodospirillales bacterium]